MFPILFKVGPITLHTYGLMVAIGFLLALKIARTEFQRRFLPMDLLDRLVFCLMMFGLLGARIVYFGVDHFAELRSDPMQFFRIWEGGLVLYGAVLAGLMVIVVFSRKYDLPFLGLTDAMAAPLLVGQSIGRLGCLAAGCCYGKPTDSFFHVTFTHPEALAPQFTPLIPTQLYEAAGDFVLFVALLAVTRKNTNRGAATVFYLIGYGLFRFVMEFFRGDNRGLNIGTFSPSQAIAILMVLMGVALFIYGKKQKTN